jgi:hypothetical protein
MPEHASRFAGLYDQQNENRIPDWGGDDLFTRMPSPPAVDDAPAPRFRRSLALVDAPEERRRTPPGAEWSGPRDRRRSRSADEAMRERAERLGLSVIDADASPQPDEYRRTDRSPHPADARQPDGSPQRDESFRPDAPHTSGESPEASESPGAAAARRWDESFGSDVALDAPPERAPNGRRTTVITGRPEGAPRPLSLVPTERRRPRRTPSDWIGARPERIMAWAFVLGLLLILLAISTADAAPR